MKVKDRAVELERMLDVVIGRARLYGGACSNHARGLADHRDQRFAEMEEAASSLRVAIRRLVSGEQEGESK